MGTREKQGDFGMLARKNVGFKLKKYSRNPSPHRDADDYGSWIVRTTSWIAQTTPRIAQTTPWIVQTTPWIGQMTGK